MPYSIQLILRIFLLFAGLLMAACSENGADAPLRFWAMGREGEAVQELVREFERRNPAIHVAVQQIPWSAAHEKLLTAYAGDALPDVFQLGNTWIPEFATLRAIEPLDRDLAAGDPSMRGDFFAGILAAQELQGQLYALPWYVDTRLLFFRKDLLAQAGFTSPPQTWNEWVSAMEAIKRLPGESHYALLLPMNEWQVPTILGLQMGAGLLRDGERFGNFQSPGFREAFRFYLNLFRRELAPAVAEAQVANLYREFARGYFAFYVTGPWNIGEFRQRLPQALQDQWSTAPLPAPRADDGFPGVSLAGGASLALTASSKNRAAAFKLLAFLTEPEQQAAFYRLTGDLPARRSAWDDPALVSALPARAFRAQIERVAATPKIPEWERIAARLAHYAERAVRGEMSEDDALTALDADVDRILEKRRWLLDKGIR